MGAGRGQISASRDQGDVTWPGSVVTSGATQVPAPAPAPASHSSIAAAGVSVINEGDQQ